MTTQSTLKPTRADFETLKKKMWRDRILLAKILTAIIAVFLIGSVLIGFVDVVFSLLNAIVAFALLNWLLTVVVILALVVIIWHLWRKSDPHPDDIPATNT